MNIDVYSSAGQKKGTLPLPASLFEAKVNTSLIHQAVVMQQANRRAAIAHAKNRSEVAGSTKKLFQQKGTGRARRGPIRSPVLRGGGKAFGPRKNQNFSKDMPRNMRRAALAACLSFQAARKAVIGLEGYGDKIKTKEFVTLLKKLPLAEARRVLFVLPEKHDPIVLSARNVPGIKTLLVGYLNPEDIMRSSALVFVGNSVEKAEEIFTKKIDRSSKKEIEVKEHKNEKKEEAKKEKKTTAKKAAPKKKTTKKSTPSA